MTLTLPQTPDYIGRLKSDFERAKLRQGDAGLVQLARSLMEVAKKLEHEKASALGLNFRYKNVQRDTSNPQHIRHESVIGKEWADDPAAPLEAGEAWNAGRRATLTGVKYALDDNGLPINPYMKTGLTGQGCLGQFGPNHAVDNGIMISERRDEQGRKQLCALGILRKYDGHAPAFAGGFAKFGRDENGAYIIDQDAIVTSQAEEFFEEMVSGSIPLMPEYEAQFEGLYQDKIEQLTRARDGKTPSEDEQQGIYNQIQTHLRLEQVEAHDPDFMKRLKAHIAGGRECFAGPVLGDNRNTDNAWIESRLSWVMINDDIWAQICGAKPKFPYALVAGDDASGVVWHKLDATLFENAYASHGPMFAYMAASYVLDKHEKGQALDVDIQSQLEDAISSFEGAPSITVVKGKPSPKRR
jgi:hypothetical protein